MALSPQLEPSKLYVYILQVCYTDNMNGTASMHSPVTLMGVYCLTRGQTKFGLCHLRMVGQYPCVVTQ